MLSKLSQNINMMRSLVNTLFTMVFVRTQLSLNLVNHDKLNTSNFKTEDIAHIKGFITNADFSQRLGYADIWAKDTTTNLRPIKVMMLGLRGFPDVQGGVETHVEHLAPLLVSQGCEVEVVVRTPYQNPEVGKEWCGVKFTKIWAPKSKGFEAILHTFLGVMYAATVRPDILHIHAIGPAIMTPLARLLGLRVVVTHHGPDYNRQKWGKLARCILLTGEWVGMRFSNSRIVISNAIRELVVSKHTVHSELIFNGVVMPDLEICESNIAQFGLKSHRYILLVSRLVPEKRHLDLIAAFNHINLPDYKLVFVGSSDHPDEYVNAVKDAARINSNIVLTGFQTGDVLRAIYAHAALFVLPSSHEGLSISLLEALSYGLPVLASDIPANLEVGLNSYSYFELGNVSELAIKLTQSLENPASNESRMYLRSWVAAQYNWRRIAEKTYKEYQSVLH